MNPFLNSRLITGRPTAPSVGDSTGHANAQLLYTAHVIDGRYTIYEQLTITLTDTTITSKNIVKSV